jgi:hypothetical protein
MESRREQHKGREVGSERKRSRGKGVRGAEVMISTEEERGGGRSNDEEWRETRGECERMCALKTADIDPGEMRVPLWAVARWMTPAFVPHTLIWAFGASRSGRMHRKQIIHVGMRPVKNTFREAAWAWALAQWPASWGFCLYPLCASVDSLGESMMILKERRERELLAREMEGYLANEGYLDPIVHL